MKDLLKIKKGKFYTSLQNCTRFSYSIRYKYKSRYTFLVHIRLFRHRFHVSQALNKDLKRNLSSPLSFHMLKNKNIHSFVFFIQRNWVFVTNSDFLFHIFLQPYIFQTMNYVRSNNLRLKYYRLTLSDCKDIKIWKFESVAI